MKTEQLELYTRAAIGTLDGVWKYYVKPEITPERVAIGSLAVVSAWMGAKATRACLEMIDK